MCVVHFRVSATKLVVYLSGCQRPENTLEKQHTRICKRRRTQPADSPYWMDFVCLLVGALSPVNHRGLHKSCTEWKTHATKCLRNWNQNVVIIETVASTLPKILITWNLPQRIQKRLSNQLELLGVLPHLLRKWFSNLTVSFVAKRKERRPHPRERCLGNWSHVFRLLGSTFSNHLWTNKETLNLDDSILIRALLCLN